MLTDLPSRMLPTNNLFPDQQQPRRSFQLVEMEALKSSIAANGILQSLLVRWVSDRQDYVIVCGERRWRCAKELQLPEVPCRVIEGDVNPAQIGVYQLIENLIRENLNPLDEARGLQRLQGLLECNREELAVHTQRSTASICRSFKLLELPNEVQSLIETGRIPVSIAAELHRCSNPVIQRELAERVAAGGMNREDVVNSVRQTISHKSSSKPKSITIDIGHGVSIRVPCATSLKDSETVITKLLKRLKEAKRTVSDMDGFARLSQQEPSDVTQ